MFCRVSPIRPYIHYYIFALSFNVRVFQTLIPCHIKERSTIDLSYLVKQADVHYFICHPLSLYCVMTCFFVSYARYRFLGTYTTTDQINFVYALILLISLYGVLIIILRLITPFLVNVSSKFNCCSTNTRIDFGMS